MSEGYEPAGGDCEHEVGPVSTKSTPDGPRSDQGQVMATQSDQAGLIIGVVLTMAGGGALLLAPLTTVTIVFLAALAAFFFSPSHSTLSSL